MASKKGLPPVPPKPPGLLSDDASSTGETIRQPPSSPIRYEPKAGPSTLYQRDAELDAPRYSELGHGGDEVPDKLDASQATDRNGKESVKKSHLAGRMDALVEADGNHGPVKSRGVEMTPSEEEMMLSGATRARRERIVLDDPRIAEPSGRGTEEIENLPEGGLNEVRYDRNVTTAGLESILPSVSGQQMKGKDVKQLAKILKKEANAEIQLLKSTIRELDNLQKSAKPMATAEESASVAYSKAAKEELKLKKIYLQTKAKWEISSAELAAKAQDLTIIRERAAQQKLQIQEKTRDVERLRTRKAEGDYERIMKISTARSASK